MSAPFADFLRQDMCLVLLRVLAEMLDNFGHPATRDQVKTELAWLAEQGLMMLQEAGSVRVATLTERGQDVAAGRAVVPGVKRPGA